VRAGYADVSMSTPDSTRGVSAFGGRSIEQATDSRICAREFTQSPR
jgi:hypothetical protein